MAEQKVKLTQLPEATDTTDTAVLLVNQNETDQRLPITHFLRAKNNLSELENTAQARANLGVPSVEDVNDKIEYLIDGKSTFLNGATLESERDFIWDDNSKSWYYWTGTFSKEVPAGSTPESTGGIGAGAWLSIGDASLRALLESTAGAGAIGTESGSTVQDELDVLNLTSNRTSNIAINSLPIKFEQKYIDTIISGVSPQGLSEDDRYWYIAEDVTVDIGVTYLCKVSRIDKSSLAKETVNQTIQSHGQGVGVLSDGRVFVGGSANSKIAIVDFSDQSVIEQDCIGFYKDFPFCYDPDSNLIYQLQDASAIGANIIRVSVLSVTNGFISDFSIDRAIVSDGYPQGITTDGVSLYIASGGSWASSTGGTWNDTWSLYRMSLGGVILDRMVYRRNSMGAVIGATASSHEPQGISFYRGKLSFMQYIGDANGAKNVIFSDSDTGAQVRAVPKDRLVIYNGLDAVGVNPSLLTAGSSIKTISSSMADGSMIVFSISGESALLSDLGIQFGTCTVFKVTSNRIYAIASEQSSSLSATSPRPKTSYVDVYGSYQSPPLISIVRNSSITVDYSSTSSASSGAIPIASVSYANKIYIHLTNTSSTNPVTIYEYSRSEIDYLISNSVSVIITNGSASVSFLFTSSGISVNTASGSAIIRRVISE